LGHEVIDIDDFNVIDFLGPSMLLLVLRRDGDYTAVSVRELDCFALQFAAAEIRRASAI
jgi:hypothetical protein